MEKLLRFWDAAIVTLAFIVMLSNCNQVIRIVAASIIIGFVLYWAFKIMQVQIKKLKRAIAILKYLKAKKQSK
jgi:hypothetical protein